MYITLRKGKHKPDREADGNYDTTTPSKLKHLRRLAESI